MKNAHRVDPAFPDRGLKVTPQRQCLLRVLHGAAHFDPATGTHHHLVCTRCGAMRDVDCGLAGLRLPAHQRHGFALSDAEVSFRGLCAKYSQSTSDQKDAARA